MPRRGGRHKVLVHGCEEAMAAFKREIAEDLGLAHKIGKDGSYKNLTTVEVGNIGGEMVRRSQAMAQMYIKHRYDAGEDRLMPADVLPKPEMMSDVTNNGNVAVSKSRRPDVAPATGQIDPAMYEKGLADIPESDVRH